MGKLIDFQEWKDFNEILIDPIIATDVYLNNTLNNSLEYNSITNKSDLIEFQKAFGIDKNLGIIDHLTFIELVDKWPKDISEPVFIYFKNKLKLIGIITARNERKIKLKKFKESIKNLFKIKKTKESP